MAKSNEEYYIWRALVLPYGLKDEEYYIWGAPLNDSKIAG